MTRILIAAALLQGCTLKDYSQTDTRPEDLTWSGGQFQMTSQGVTDNCAGGAFNSLLMPDDDATPTDWDHLFEFPSWEDMEERDTYSIQLQDPFSEMEVTMTQSDTVGSIQMSGGSQDEIPLFDDDGCFVDIGISAIIQIVDDNTVTGQATFRFQDSSGMNCTFERNCEMMLEFTGNKQ